MEIKKNPKYELSRYSPIYFQIGIALMLLISWRALEFKSFDSSNLTSIFEDNSSLIEEVIPITDPLVIPPPPPAPTITAVMIVAVENEAEVEESMIESMEINQDDEILDVKEIEEEVFEEEIVDVPFAVIENVPIFPGCESAETNLARKNCMSDKVEQFVLSTFDTSFAADLGLEGRQKIFVRFKIDHNGDVVDVQARAPHPRLEVEAVKVVKSLPKMIPGKQRGKPVGVLYALPIVFQVEN